MKNREVISAFVNGHYVNGQVRTTNLRTDGNKLYNYSTCIGQKLSDGTIIVNSTKYSVTTSKIQTYLRYAVSESGKKSVEVLGVPLNAYDLTRYVK